jgi:hypothetical protein
MANTGRRWPNSQAWFLVLRRDSRLRLLASRDVAGASCLARIPNSLDDAKAFH